MKVKSKPVEIDAQKIVGVSNSEVSGGYDFSLDNGTTETVNAAQCGQHTPQAGDYLIFGAPDDTYLCPKAVFEAKYEPVEQSTPEPADYKPDAPHPEA